MTVLQRRRVESFLVEARPWALRQARKKYPHIPADLYEDVYQQACVEMLRGNPRASDRPGLYAYLSRVLAGVLGRAHKQWCHQHLDLDDHENPIEVADDSSFTLDDAADNRQLSAVLNELMNRRLLAPERAVLQLQIGVGLDPDQIKDALGMSDRQYKRRRYEGVQKLRESLEDYTSGRVCGEHAERITLAATGELSAGGLEELNEHLAHCGSCRAEIRDLRTTVRARFALAPWPLLLATPGLLAAKASAIVTAVKGGGSGVGALGGAKVAVATLASVAAVAGGAIAVSSGGDRAARVVPVAESAVPAAASAPAATVAARKIEKAATRKERKAGKRHSASSKYSSSGSKTTEDATSPPSDGGSTASAQPGGSATGAVGKATDTVRNTVDGVRSTTRKVVDGVQKTAPLPQSVQQVTDSVQDTLDQTLAPLGNGG